MGTKFANLQVHCDDALAVKELCPHAHAAALADGWVTVVGDGIEWGTAQKEARRLSKALPCAVLSTEYFDDDFVEVTVYKGGRKAAGHVPAEYEGFARSVGKPKKFAEALDLPEEDEKLLRAIFRETNPEVCVHLMESLLGCVLWVDSETLSDARPLNRSYLEEYLARKAEKAKIKNQTKLKQLDEMQGEFDYRLTYPIVRYEGRQENGKSVWSISPDGRLHMDFSTNIPGQVEAYRAYARSENMTVLTFGLWEEQTRRTTLCCFADDGEVVDKIECEDAGAFHASFIGDRYLFREGVCHDLRTHEVLWDLGIGRTAYGIEAPRAVSDGTYAIVYDAMNGQDTDSRLAIFNMDGVITHSAELPMARHWKYPVIYDGRIYMYYSVSRNTSALVCYDGELTELWRTEIPGMNQLGSPLLDEASQLLYFYTSYNRFAVFDMRERKIAAVKEIQDDEFGFMKGVLPGVGPIMLTGDASIEVWNSDLVAISRHRTKGCISNVVWQGGRCYMITLKENGSPSPVPFEAGRTVRLYELTAASGKR